MLLVQRWEAGGLLVVVAAIVVGRDTRKTGWKVGQGPIGLVVDAFFLLCSCWLL